MIEIQARLLRGPVYFAEETIQCLITLRNVPTQDGNIEEQQQQQSSQQSEDNVAGGDDTREQAERLCWANVQLHCFFVPDESQVDCQKVLEHNLHTVKVPSRGSVSHKRSSIALETYTSNDTSFHECLLRAEKGFIVYSTEPKILFCDLQLAPHECQTFVYTETLPAQLNPSYSSPRIKYHYKLTIGAQRIGSPIQLLKMPIRVLIIEKSDLEPAKKSVINNGLENSPSSPSSFSSSFHADDETKDDSTPLDMALHLIEYQICHRTPHSFNITSNFGRVAKFFIYKTAHKLGEDIIGMFNFADSIVPCVKFSVQLQSEEIIGEPYRLERSKATTNHVVTHAKCQEFTLHSLHSQMSLTIPLTATASFTNDIVSYQWKLHFRFVIGQRSEEAISTTYNETEDGIQHVAPRRLHVQVMTWDFPIKVMPTHPAHVAKGFQLPSIGTLTL